MAEPNKMLEETANYLLNHCFVLGGVEDQRAKYLYVQDHLPEVRAVFAPLGYAVTLYPAPLQAAALVNEHEGSQARLLKYESILLLVLRLLYLQKRESLAASADQVLVTVEEVQTELQKMNLPRRLDQRTLEELMRTLRRYNLARPVGRLTGLDSRIEVFPTVLLALPDADLADAAAEQVVERVKAVHSLVRSYVKETVKLSEQAVHRGEVRPVDHKGAAAVARFGRCSCRGAPACALAAGFLRFEPIDIVPEVGGIEALRNAVGNRVSGKAADRAGDHAAEHVGSVVHAEINARNAHGEREQQRRPADPFVAAEKHRKRGRHCRGHMARGEALVAFGMLTEHFPILLENAAVVRIRAWPGDERFKADVCYQSADGKREQHRCAVPPRFAEKLIFVSEFSEAPPYLRLTFSNASAVSPLSSVTDLYCIDGFVSSICAIRPLLTTALLS